MDHSTRVDTIKQQLAGQWLAVLSRYIDPSLLDTEHHPCPVCGGTDRFRAFDDVAETGGTICNRCGTYADGISTIRWITGCTFGQALEELQSYTGEMHVRPIVPVPSKPKPKKELDPSRIMRIPHDERLFEKFCAAKKGITPDGLRRAKAFCAKHIHDGAVYPVIALAVHGSSDEVVGYAVYRADAKPWKVGNGKSASVKNLGPTSEGIIGDRLYHPIQPVLKTEGPSDLLAAMSLDPTEQYAAIWTNANGAKQKPIPWVVERLAGCKVHVCHDPDTAGQTGAIWVKRNGTQGRAGWATALAESAASVRNIVLPIPSDQDLRDWICAGGTIEKLFSLPSKIIAKRSAPKLIELDGRGDWPLDEYSRYRLLKLAEKGKVNIDSGTAGAGKTTEAIKLAASGAWGERGLFFHNTHKNCEEIVDQFKAKGIDAKKLPLLSEQNCERYEQVASVMRYSGDYRIAICESCEKNKNGCLYQVEADEAKSAKVIVATKTAEVFQPTLLKEHGGDWQVYDECSIRSLRHSISATAEEIEKACKLLIGFGLYQRQRIQADCDWLLGLIDARECTSFTKSGFVPSTEDETKREKGQSSYHRELYRTNAHVDIKRAAALIMQLRHRDVQILHSNSAALLIRNQSLRRGSTVVYLDATADIDLMGNVFDLVVVDKVDMTAMFPIVEVNDLTPRVKPIVQRRPKQYPDARFCVGASRKDFKSHSSEMARIVLADYFKNRRSKIGIIGHRKHLEYFFDYWPAELPKDLILDPVYFRQGPDRGSNQWLEAGCDVLHVFGTPSIPADALPSYMAIYGLLDKPIGDRETVTYQYRPDEPSWQADRYADSQTQAVWDQVVTASLTQAVGRSRPLLPTGCDCIVYSDAPLAAWDCEVIRGRPDAPTDKQLAIVQALITQTKQHGGWIETAAIAEELGDLNERTLRWNLSELRKMGIIQRKGDRGGFAPSSQWGVIPNSLGRPSNCPIGRC